MSYLGFSMSGSWKWAPFFEAIHGTTEEALRASGYGTTAVRPESALRATPNLRELRVTSYKSRRVEHDHVINPDLFGDDFAAAAVRLCPKLTKVSIHAAAADGSNTITTFTDRALRSLATLRDLKSLDVSAVHVTGGGLFQLVAHHAATTRCPRKYAFQLGDKRREATSNMFYDVLEGFLYQLVQYNGEILSASRRVSLHLVNINDRAVDKCWGKAYFQRICALADQVQQTYPTLQLRGLVHEYDEGKGTIKRMREFVVATPMGTLPTWEDDDMDLDEDTAINSVFWNRTM